MWFRRSQVRTLKTHIVSNEKAPEGANSVNGASNGIRLEKYCIEFAELSIHETELMEQVYKFLYYFCI